MRCDELEGLMKFYFPLLLAFLLLGLWIPIK